MIGIWKHKSRLITFCLCVDDFGVKYFNKQDVHHLIYALQQHYKLSIDWEGKHHCGFNLHKYNYVDVTIPDYIPSVLKRFQHIQTTPTYTPYKPLPTYNKTRQIAIQPDTSPPLSTPNETKVRQIIGCLSCYARALDNTMLVVLNTIAQS